MITPNNDNGINVNRQNLKIPFFLTPENPKTDYRPAMRAEIKIILNLTYYMLPFLVKGLLSSSLTLEVFIMFTEGFSPLLPVPSPFPGGLSSWLVVSKRFTGGLFSSLEVSLLFTEGVSSLWDGTVVGDSEAFASAEGLYPTLS